MVVGKKRERHVLGLFSSCIDTTHCWDAGLSQRRDLSFAGILPLKGKERDQTTAKIPPQLVLSLVDTYSGHQTL